MAKVKTSESSSYHGKRMRPALSPEARENQLISYAIDLVEERLLNGTASSQETTHFLKLGSTKARLEKVILEKQAELATAKTEQIRSQQRNEELMREAIAAMRSYQGLGGSDDEPDDY